MVDAIGRANDLLEQYAALARAELPAGTDVVDVHTHLGEDIDGMSGDRDELLAVGTRLAAATDLSPQRLDTLRKAYAARLKKFPAVRAKKPAPLTADDIQWTP